MVHTEGGRNMSTIDLVILGHLINNPQSAYEMKKSLESENIQDWVKIGMPTIYQNLIKLNQKGFLDAKVVKEGEMPEKTIYSINEHGLKQFQSLMRKYSEEVNNNYFDFCSFVVNLDKVDPGVGLEMLRNLQDQFHTIQRHLSEEIAQRDRLPFQQLSIMKLYHGLYTFLCDWSEDLQQELGEMVDHNA
jgi:DNA-binding PadR family transcriptional regulator